MSEGEPKPPIPQSAETKFESFTQSEAQNLSVFCEKLITGKPIEPNTNPQEFREQMWADARQVILKEVIPSLTYFKRDQAMENAVTSGPAGSPERAEAEIALVQNYIAQLKSGPGGFSTTPKQTLETGQTNCVMKSAIAATIFEELGINTEAGSVSGHKIQVIKNAIGELFYVDPNDKIGKINPQVETRGSVHVYVMSEEERADLQVPYSRIVVSKPAIGFLYSMFNNMSETTLKGHNNESRQLWDKYKDVVVLQGTGDESRLRDQLLPELEYAHEETSKDDLFIQNEAALLQKIGQEVLGKKEVEEAEINQVGKQAIIEARDRQVGEQVLAFLQGEEVDFPTGFSAQSEALYKATRQAFKDLEEANPALRTFALRRFIKAMHPAE